MRRTLAEIRLTQWPPISATLRLVILIGLLAGPVQAAPADTSPVQAAQAIRRDTDSADSRPRDASHLIRSIGPAEHEWPGRPAMHLRRQRVDLDPAMAGGQTKRPGDTLVIEVIGGDTFLAVVTRRSEYVRFSSTYTCRLTGYPLSLAILTVVNGRLGGTIYLAERSQYYQIMFSPEVGSYCMVELDSKAVNRINANDQVGGGRR